MANILTTNPVQYDTTGETSAITSRKLICGITVVASADNWSCVLKDGASGNVIFRADSAVVGQRTAFWGTSRPFLASGLYFTTGTNVALVLVYCNDPGKYIDDFGIV